VGRVGAWTRWFKLKLLGWTKLAIASRLQPAGGSATEDKRKRT